MRAKQSSTAIGMYSISGTFTPPIPPSIVAIPTGRSPKRVRSATYVRAAILGAASVPTLGGETDLVSARQSRAGGASRSDPKVAQSEGLLHDAQNLLGAVGLYCDLLSAPGVLKPEHRRYAVELRLAGARSSALLRRLVLSSLAPVGPRDRRLVTRTKAPPAGSMAKAAREDAVRASANSARPVTLRMIVDRCSGLLGQVAGGRAIEVSYGGAASVPVLVPEETIERILVNLVRNAAAGLKESGDGGATWHSPAGGRIASESVVVREASDGTEDETPGAIRIRAGLPVNRVDNPRPWPFGHVRLTVEDSGCGMTSECLERVLHPREAPARGGHGMGLRVVRELVAASGGELRVMSAPGIGTQVQIDWPAVATLSPEEIVGRRSSSPAPIQSGPAGLLRLPRSRPVRETQRMSNGRRKPSAAGIPVKTDVGFRAQRALISATGAGRRIAC